MSEHDLPEGTVNDEPRTFNEGVDDITDLLSDPDDEPDLSEDDQENEQVESEDDEDLEGEEPDEESDGEEEADPEDEDEEQEDEDGSGEYAGGRFAADNAKVKLDDGTTITVAELKRNNLFQRDYTRKTTELAEQRKEFEQTQQRVNQAAEQLAQHRDFLLRVYQNTMPQPPDPSMMEDNPVGYMQAKDAYERRMAEFNQIRQMQQVEQQRQQAESQQEMQRRLAEEREKLHQVMPELKDPAQFEAFRTDLMKHGTEDYGVTPEELSSIDDHRYLRILSDAIAYRKLKAKAPAARQKLESKPKLKQRRRMDPKAKTSREAQARQQKLRKSGDFDAGVAALMDLDL